TPESLSKAARHEPDRRSSSIWRGAGAPPTFRRPMPPVFTRYQKFVIGVLAFLQFTIVLDFMIIGPLGALLLPALQITTRQFGLAVSVSGLSAGVCGHAAARFADQFDRN